MTDDRMPDDALLDGLRALWERADPPPPGFAERLSFVLALDDLDAEVLRLRAEVLEPSGARASEHVRTITFGGDTMTVMVTISPDARRGFRIDGWVAPATPARVELRLADGSRETAADLDGRFVIESVPGGLAQLVLHPTDASSAVLDHDVVAPAVQL